MRAYLLATELFIVLVLMVEASGTKRQWWGRTCCEHAFNSRCRKACRKARSLIDLHKGCSASDENFLMKCAMRQDAAQRCCGSVNVTERCSSMCRSVGMESSQLNQNTFISLTQNCGKKATECFQNFTMSQPTRDVSEGLRCCDQGSLVGECRSRCRSAVRGTGTEEEMVQEISDHCGVPDHSAPLWQCFLRLSSGSHNPHEYNIDSARLMCCSKAKSDECRDLCKKTYTTQYMENSQTFHDRCSFRYHEYDLNTCLDQVSSECEMGCSDLSFCSNFNNRPTEMFRSCNHEADTAASDLYQQWTSGTLPLPNVFDFKLSIKAEVKTCDPDMWRAVACVIHIKPCQSHARSNSLCRSDCEGLMSRCLDKNSLPKGMTVQHVCQTLLPHSQESSCISVRPYLDKSKTSVSSKSEITIPCSATTCQRNQVCVLNSRHCPADENCLPYKCIPGCPLGEVVTVVMPINSYVRIPSHDLDCHRVCRCGRDHHLHQCRLLGCSNKKDCTLKTGRTEAHNSWFQTDECSSCFCYDGNYICNKCSAPRSNIGPQYTGLPCNCDPVYKPVCGLDGVTYANPCLAKCRGWKHGKPTPGTCSTVNHCNGVRCAANERCVITRSVCIEPEEKCKQYSCIKSDGKLKTTQAQDITHNGPRSMHQRDYTHNSSISMDQCHSDAVVCGMDGNTYTSECSAWSFNTPADYWGECSSIALAQYNSTCEGVKCAHPVPDYCRPIYPPGACCPICAAELKLLPNPLLIQRVNEILADKPLSLADILESLRTQNKIVECAMFGYVSYEGDVIIIMTTANKSPTLLQMKCCLIEAEKIGTLLSTSSPTVTTYLSLSLFASTNIRTSNLTRNIASSSAHSSISCTNYSIFLLALILYVFTNFRCLRGT